MRADIDRAEWRIERLKRTSDPLAEACEGVAEYLSGSGRLPSLQGSHPVMAKYFRTVSAHLTELVEDYKQSARRGER